MVISPQATFSTYYTITNLDLRLSMKRRLDVSSLRKIVIDTPTVRDRGTTDRSKEYLLIDFFDDMFYVELYAINFAR